jgi:DNA invertase Pin-like site-specific DNA recombinase
MVTDRVRIPKKRTESVRVAGYVRISAENHSHSTKQNSAIRRYAERRKLYVANIYVDRPQRNHG